MDLVVLKNQSVCATFAPEQGMNMTRLQVDQKDLIDLSTQPLFEEHFAGLGCLIGPHFHHRPLDRIPPVPSEGLFPHIAKVRARGVSEPFSHGIARYAPWKFEKRSEEILARLSGKDLWNGVSLASLEGFDFEMAFGVALLEKGLSLDLSVESEKNSVIGLHYYYRMKGGRVRAKVEEIFRTPTGWQKIPEAFLDEKGLLCLDAKLPVDFGFLPKAQNGCYEVVYESEDGSLRIRFEVEGGEASFQIYRPEGASYICLEPLTAKNPRDPKCRKDRLRVQIEWIG